MELQPSKPLATPKRPQPTGQTGGIPKIDDAQLVGGGTVLTGDITGSGSGTIATTIASNIVSNTKLRDSVALSVIGRSANTSGDPADIAASSDGDILRRSGTTLGFGSILGSSISDFDERAQDAVGTILADSSEIDFTYTDATPEITAVLKTTTVSAASYGSSTSIPSFTVDSKGRLTAASGNVVIAPAGTLTGATLASNVLASSLTSVGTLTGGATGAGFTIALGTSTLTGDLPFANLAQIAGFSILAKAGTGTGDVAALTAGTDSVLMRSGSGDLTFGTIVTNQITADAVTYAKIQNVSATSRILGRITAGAGDIEELTAANVATIINSSLDHGTLTGLTDDDHVGYALLAGRSGGQSLSGGTAANDDLTLQGTTNSTRTTSGVFIQPNGGNTIIGGTSLAVPAIFGTTGSLVDATGNTRGNHFAPTVESSGDGLGGIGFQPIIRPGAALGTVYGIIGLAGIDRAADTTSYNITDYYTNFYRSQSQANYTGTISTVHTFRIANFQKSNAGATITTHRGLSIAELNVAGTNWGIYQEGATNWYTGTGNIGMGTETFGTSAATVLAIKNGTAPTTSPADMVQIFSVDISAGNASLGLRTETAVTASAAGASDAYLNIKVNGSTYKLLLHT